MSSLRDNNNRRFFVLAFKFTSKNGCNVFLRFSADSSLLFLFHQHRLSKDSSGRLTLALIYKRLYRFGFLRAFL